jgi:homoserine dehydrogenase
VAPPTLQATGRPGITGVSGVEIAAAGRLGLCPKLVAVAERDADGRPTASVVLSAIDREAPLGRTDGVLNRIEVQADPVGTVAFAGPGAGGDATSSAVLGDLVALARGGGSTWAGLPPAAARSTGLLDPVVRTAAEAPAGRWFAFLPGIDPEALQAVSGDGLETVAGMAGGSAVCTSAVPLERARALLRAAGSPAADAPLYPVLA